MGRYPNDQSSLPHQSWRVFSDVDCTAQKSVKPEWAPLDFRISNVNLHANLSETQHLCGDQSHFKHTETNMYEQLDRSKSHIRLLRLFPGHESDDIVCELFTTSLDEPDTYEALSYVWGSSMSTSPIALGDTLKSVTRNLESALRHLRDDKNTRILWIDALCINQEDLEERRWQVQLMGGIYSGASQVVVWLGLDRSDGEDIMESIRRFGDDSKLHWNGLFTRQGGFPLNLLAFLHNDWWKRIWTVQEAVLAGRLTYQRGRTCLSGEAMINFAQSYFEHFRRNGCCAVLANSFNKESHISVFHDLDGVMDKVLRLRQFKLMSRNSRFDEVASLFRYRVATNPLDMVYGMLGISCGITDSSIDYRLSKTQAYELAARDCMLYNKDLNVLSHVINHSTIEGSVYWRKDHPSWVPDWTIGDAKPGSDVELIRYRAAFLQHYNACGASKLQPSSNYLCGKLLVDGVCCDLVETVSEVVLERSFLQESHRLKAWRKTLGIDTHPSRPYVGGDTISEAFWRTVCQDIMVPAVAGDGSAIIRRAIADDRAMYYAYWYLSFLILDDVNIRAQKAGLTRTINAFKDHIAKSIARRRLFVSRKGYIGLAPLGTETGDRICVLAGGKAPFIVRDAQEDDENTSERVVCRLLGDAYVHGLMDGEAMKLVQEGVAKLEGFELI